MYEFARRKGSKDKKPRRKIFNARNAANLAATTGLAVAGARLYKNRKNLSLKKNTQQVYRELLPATKAGVSKSLTKDVARNMGRDQVIDKAEKLVRTPILAGAGVAGAIGAGSYLKRKKENYSRINTNTGDIMFIGNVEKTSYEFARRKGAKDRKPRSRRSALGTAAKLAGGAAAIGATGLALKNAPKAAKAGMRAAKSARGSLAGQNSTNKLFGVGAGLKTAGASLRRNMGKDVRRGAGAVAGAGRGAADRVGRAVSGAKQAFKTNRQNAGKRKAQRMKIANQMRQNMG